jgi:hypothetical protein
VNPQELGDELKSMMLSSKSLVVFRKTSVHDVYGYRKVTCEQQSPISVK